MNNISRPLFDTYLMSLCLLIAQRSLDPDTKHGSLAVDEENSILATGYNSPPRKSDDSKVPLLRPQKYSWFLHSEEALICNAARNGVSLRGSRIFITGHPCSACTRKIINAGVTEIVIGPIESACVDKNDRNISYEMLSGHDIRIKHFEDRDGVLGLLNNTQHYLIKKLRGRDKENDIITPEIV